MFERRLKVILLILAVMVLVLMGRAAQVQIFNRDYWRQEARSAMRRTHPIEAGRGSIKDRLGRVLAIDQPCVDACVEYPALTHPPDPEWVKQKASARLKARMGDAYLKLKLRQRIPLRDKEVEAVLADIDQMWAKLAQVSGNTPDQIEDIREGVISRVQMRQRYIWHKHVEEALRKQGERDEEQGGRLKRLLSADDDSGSEAQITVSEQKEAHVIIRALDTAAQNELGKNIDRYPGLVLRPGTHRHYPYADIACHVLGNLTRVNAQDLKASNKGDDLRDYYPNDLIGRSGVEALCEPSLKGIRGRVERVLGDESILAQQEPQQGKDVSLSIDIELQQQIQSVFSSATLRDAKGVATEEGAMLHGAAVVLDVKTNQVLALVSYPTYDLNHMEELYSRLREDDINDPLRNRATMSAFEPGSTVKPLCGLAGITEGVIGVNDGIECKGYLWLDNRKWSQGGRCWVANSSFTQELIDKGIGVAHHPVPEPHKGHDGNPDGFLTYSDGLERSCNVYFETVADRLGIDRLSSWYDKFGLGRATGIGLAEARGRLPRDFHEYTPMRRIIGFSAGIGQGWMAATPIQMANATAMIARGGIWMRPQLLLPDSDGSMPAVKADAWHGTPERQDLHLSPEGLAAAKDGMLRVVNRYTGTGKALVAGDKLLQSAMICGKTGTAQASAFMVPVRDEAGNILRNPNHTIKRVPVKPSTPEDVNPQAPWYRMTDGKIDHAWYVGFAPVDKPQVAFAVLVEYGGSGGVAAASVAREALEACIARKYLVIPSPQPDVAMQTAMH